MHQVTYCIFTHVCNCGIQLFEYFCLIGPTAKPQAGTSTSSSGPRTILYASDLEHQLPNLTVPCHILINHRRQQLLVRSSDTSGASPYPRRADTCPRSHSHPHSPAHWTRDSDSSLVRERPSRTCDGACVASVRARAHPDASPSMIRSHTTVP